MDGEGQIAEALCDMVEELAKRKLLQRGRGRVNATTSTHEGRMEGFNDKDATNLQLVKDAMAERAIGGGLIGGADAAAATAFAALLDAETRRTELTLKSMAQEKAPASPAAGGSWAENISGKQPLAEIQVAAA